eukprot:g195.t1
MARRVRVRLAKETDRGLLCLTPIPAGKYQDEEVRGLSIAVIGAGVMGLQTALVLSGRGARVTLYEREAGVGGVWRTFANSGSRVQVVEPGYRLLPDKPATDYTTRDEVVRLLEETLQRIEARNGSIKFGVTVELVRKIDDDKGPGGHVDVTYRSSASSSACVAVAQHDYAVFCTGGLQKPNVLELPGEGPGSSFRGRVIDGVGGGLDSLGDDGLAGKSVVVIGMGAFAVENARECLFRGAASVTIVARNRNLVFAKIWTYAGFQQPEDFMPLREIIRRQRAAKAKAKAAKAKTAAPKAGGGGLNRLIPPGAGPPDLGAVMLDTYERSNAEEAMPDELRKYRETRDVRLVQIGSPHRESFGTIPTASDAFFIGHALKRLRTIRGEISRLTETGVVLTTGEAIDGVDVIIKNVGFQDPDAWIGPVVGQTHMHSPCVINERVWLIKAERARMTREWQRDLGGAEAFLDFINIPAVAPALARAFSELFAYYAARPSALRALMDTGALPRVPIGRDTGLHWSRGQWAMMTADPAIQDRVNACRRQIATDVRSRWTWADYFKANRQWWRYCCKRMTGDEDAVPYIWEHLESAFDVLTYMQARQKIKSEPQRSRTAAEHDDEEGSGGAAGGVAAQDSRL